MSRYLADRFDIDFVALTFTQDGSDVRAAREALAEVGALETKILAKVLAKRLPCNVGGVRAACSMPHFALL